ncbi:MBL fold metallo-hydrolase [Thalassotalea aquiviva]|uniref:MBL fold metallo-hydrolase n=1 Tax=Thalassotalea aquiviva TaxID=3242415 RepID=UPI00352A6CA0
MKSMIKILASLSACLALCTQAVADDRFANVEIKAQAVSGDVYMLTGSGGNIGVLATDSGLLLVDDQFAPLATKIENAMQAIKSVPLKYIVNTHYHGDHTGSNAHFGKHAPIFAHKNVRTRVKNDNKQSEQALPVVTYDDGVTIYLGNEEIQIMHLPKSHTDGDSVVYFKQSNVLHMGDLFFQGRFPFIDLKGGGTVKGYLDSIKRISKRFPNDVKIIPGHGDLSDMQGVQKVIEMIEYSIAVVEQGRKDGKSDEQILTMGLGDKYKDWSWNFINEERWLKTLLSGL